MLARGFLVGVFPAQSPIRFPAQEQALGVLLDQQAYDEGLKLLAGTAPVGFEAEWADRRGDLLIAQGKAEEARAEYRTALEKAGKSAPLRRVIQIKLDALGGAGA